VNEPVVGWVVVIREDLEGVMVVVAHARVLLPIVAGIMTEVATAIEVATMEGVRVVATAIVVVPAVAITGDSAVRWILDEALVVLMDPADSVETVDTGNDLQIVAGKRVVFKSSSNVK
jgi:hypothetical protein